MIKIVAQREAWRSPEEYKVRLEFAPLIRYVTGSIAHPPGNLMMGAIRLLGAQSKHTVLATRVNGNA